MKDENALQLLGSVMGWGSQHPVMETVHTLQLLAEYKYDDYQRFSPGKRFIESLALWLNQFSVFDRAVALDFVMRRVVYFSDAEMSHLVQSAYPDLIVPELVRMISEEKRIPNFYLKEIVTDPRFVELKLKSLYLGLSDGARTNELRRSSSGDIGNEQIWQAYELGKEKTQEMLEELQKSLAARSLANKEAKFNVIWLLDDFSGSGNTYIRYEHETDKFKGKIKKIYEQLYQGELVDPLHYEVFLLLYVATRQSIDHIEYWSERFTAARGYKPLQVKVLCPIEPGTSVTDESFQGLLTSEQYRDVSVVDKHFLIGGTDDERRGFAGCALPTVLDHNTPNNSVYILWGPEESSQFQGLFPRVSRHREF